MRHTVHYLLAALPALSTAQSYQPLLVPGRSWVIATTYAYEQCLQAGFPPWSDCTERALYFPDGDTVIQGVSYQKCMRRVFSLGSGWQSPFTLSSPVYAGALRENTGARKVFAYDTLNQAGMLLYDFNLLPGEEVTVRLDPFGNPGDYTMKVDTVFTLPDGRRKWIFEDYHEMVEGVGMNHGLFPTPVCFEVCVSLACLRNDGVPVFDESNWPFQLFNPAPVCDFQITDQEEPVSGRRPVVSPNPGTGVFYLKNVTPGADIRVFGADGRPVRAQHSAARIDISAAPPGMYFLLIRSGAVTGTCRLVKE